MKNIDKKLNTKQKTLFIFLLVLGNALMAVITFSEEPPRGQSPPPSPIERGNYVNVRVSGKLKTELDPLKPVCLVGSISSTVIRDAFILERFEIRLRPETFIEQKTGDEFLVSIPHSQLKNAVKDEAFFIFPNALDIQPRKRKNYEVTY